MVNYLRSKPVVMVIKLYKKWHSSGNGIKIIEVSGTPVVMVLKLLK